MHRYPFILALLLTLVLGLQPRHDVKTALRLLCEDAARGDSLALYQLAGLYERGFDSIPKDSVKATLTYLMSAKKGYAPAASYLGYRYLKGDGVVQNIDSAIYWIHEAAIRGDAKGANNLGYMYLNGIGIIQNCDSAYFWLKKASDNGLPSAHAQLADMLREGTCVPADTFSAMLLYRKATLAGLADADLKLENMMRLKWQSLPADSAIILASELQNDHAPVSVATLLMRAAETDPHACTLLGEAYSLGRGVPYSHAKSIEYFFRGALGGDRKAITVINELLDIFPDALQDDRLREIATLHNHGIFNPDVLTAPYWKEISAH